MPREVNRSWQWLAPRRPGWWLLVVVAAASLLVMGVRPTIPGAPVHTGVALLVTDGASDHEVLRLIDSVGPSRVFRMPDADPTGLIAPFPVVRTLEHLVLTAPDIVSVVVAGWGLEPEEAGSPPVSVRAVPSPLPDGIALAPVPTTPFGIPLRLAGRVRGEAAGSVVLRDPTGVVDSAMVDDDGRFAFSYLPPAAGPTEVMLAAPAIDSAAVAWQVADPPAGRVLVLEAAPTFEGTALRHWLVAGGYAVAHRSRVSRDVYRTEFVDLEEASLQRLTSPLLDGFDLIVLDEETLEALATAEVDALRRAVMQAGTGVLVLTGDVVSRRGGEGTFFLTDAVRGVEDLEERTVRPVWTAGMAAGTAPPPVPLPAAPAFIEARFGQEATVDDGTGHTLVQAASRGAGRVAAMVRLQSTRWLRYGESGAYARLWAAILSEVMRDAGDRPTWRMTTPFPSLDRAMVLEGQPGDSIDHVTVTAADGNMDTVHVAPDDEGFSRGRYWPRRAGWHRIGTGTGTGPLFFVWGPEAWPPVTAERRRDATAAAAILQDGQPDTAALTTRRPLPLGWVFALFLAAVTLLWLAEDRVTVARRG